jgi:Ras-related protein Rab-5C
MWQLEKPPFLTGKNFYRKIKSGCFEGRSQLNSVDFLMIIMSLLPRF